MRYILICLVVGLLAGCSSGPPGLGQGPRCEMTSQGELLLRGPTDRSMLECVKAIAPLKARTIVVDSTGGPADAAMSIADLLAPAGAEIVVRGQCNSSCANYFLPVARRITLSPGAMILLHGSVDAALVAEGATQAVADQQKDFAARHHVPEGWLLYRSADDMAKKALGKYLEGDIETWGAEAELKAVLVEETLLRSCLGKIEIAPFVDTGAQRIYRDKAIQRGLARQGIYPSGTLRCKLA